MAGGGQRSCGDCRINSNRYQYEGAVVEDSANGSRAAKTAGMTCIGFRNPDSGNQDLSVADKIIYKITELKDIF